MVRTAEPETAEIIALTHDGRGIARTDGKTVFVTGALPGEAVEFKRRRRRRDHDEAQLLSIHNSSPHRVEPQCRHADVCGGCSLQHIRHTEQVSFKQQTLLDNLKRIGGVQPEELLAPLVGSPWHYRRRARLGVKWVKKKGRVLVGFREKSAPYIADIDSCEVLESKVAVLLKPLAELIQSLSIMDRLPQIEVAVADNITALVLRVLDPPTEDDLRKLNDFAALSKVEFYLQSGGIETISPLSVATPLSYKLPDHDIEIFFEPSDFIQINADMNNRMLNHALELLKIKNTENVLDLFCGLGNFTLPIAKHAARVDAVEGDAALVKRARHNAKVNNIENIAFHLANLFESVGDFPWSRSSYDAILLDPPRAGAKEIVVGINQFNAQRILYVSCHPGTLARDAGTLVKEHGYELKAAGIMDMFPHTAHVESIALFARS